MSKQRRRPAISYEEVAVSGLREKVAALPGTLGAWRAAKSLVDRLSGLPPIDYSTITGELIRSCVGKSDPVMLDVGCNDGESTLWFLDLFESPTIYCFEPDPRAIGRFKKQVPPNAPVTLFELAISDHQGSVGFYQSGGRRDNKWLVEAMPEGWDLSGSIKEPYRHLDKHPFVTFEKKIQVATATLDSVCENHGIGPIDFLWLDVQGAEMDVFRGAPNTLAQTRFLYAEYSNRELYKGQSGLREIVKYLKDFSVVVRYEGDVLLRNDKLSPVPRQR